MRKLGDLLTGEPLALTGAITATGNVLILMGVGDLSPEVVAGLNVMVGAWFGLLRWLVVPNAAAQEQAAVAKSAGFGEGVAETVAAVQALDTPPAAPAKRPAKKR